MINEIFNQGPQAVIDRFVHSAEGLRPMDVKELADICWTRASSLAKAQTREAAGWARAALAGYEILSKSNDSALSESAAESVEILRSWSLIRN